MLLAAGGQLPWWPANYLARCLQINSRLTGKFGRRALDTDPLRLQSHLARKIADHRRATGELRVKFAPIELSGHPAAE